MFTNSIIAYVFWMVRGIKLSVYSVRALWLGELNKLGVIACRAEQFLALVPTHDLYIYI